MYSDLEKMYSCEIWVFVRDSISVNWTSNSFISIMCFLYPECDRLYIPEFAELGDPPFGNLANVSICGSGGTVGSSDEIAVECVASYISIHARLTVSGEIVGFLV